MSLATNITNLATRIATEFKAVYSKQGDLGTLNTTNKTNLVSALNEIAAATGAAPAALADLTDVTIATPSSGQALVWDGSKWVNDDVAPPIPDATDAVKGIVELATTAEAAAGADTTRAVTPAGVKAATNALSSVYQPLDSDLTAIAALATTAYGRALLGLADQAALMGLIPAASATVQGKVELATTAETTAGTDATRAVTPAGLKAVADTKQSTSQKGVAGGYASLDGGGKVPASQLPASLMTYEGVWNAATNVPTLSDGTGDPGMVYRVGTGGTRNLGSGNITFDVGDYAIYNSSGVWEKSDTTDAVSSVAGRTGDVTLVKGDVGLGNVDNTSDANKPVSTAQQTALNGKQNLDATLTALAGLTTAANQMIYSTGADAFAMTALSAFGRSLIDDANASAGRTTLDVYSKAEIGDPETNWVTVFEAALV